MLDPTTLGLSTSLLDEIASFLNVSADELFTSRPEDTGEETFGASPASVGCAGDASLARHHVAAAIADMVVGLRGYCESLLTIPQKMDEVDAQAHVALTKQALSCATVSFADPSGCSLADGHRPGRA